MIDIDVKMFQKNPFCDIKNNNDLIIVNWQYTNTLK